MPGSKSRKNTDFKEHEGIKQKPGLSPSPEKRQGLDLTCLDPVIPARRQARSDSSERSVKLCVCLEGKCCVVQSLPRKPGHHSSLSWKLQATVPHTRLGKLAWESWQQSMINLPNQKLKIKCDTVNIAFWPELHTAKRMTEVTCQSTFTTNVPCNLPVASSAAQKTALKATVLPLRLPRLRDEINEMFTVKSVQFSNKREHKMPWKHKRGSYNLDPRRIRENFLQEVTLELLRLSRC